MAGLFSMPSPEMVRANARQRLQKNAIGLSQLPAGRGGVALAGQAGGLFGEAIGRGMGGVNPVEDKARRFQNIQQSITKEANRSGWDLTKPEGQIKLISESVKLLGEFPEQQFAALQMLNQLRSQVPVESESFSDFQQIPGSDLIGQRGNISGKFINVKQKENTGDEAFSGFEKIPGTDYVGQKSSKTGKYINVKDKDGNKVSEGPAVVPSALDREIIKVAELVGEKEIQVGDDTFSPSEITNQDTYNTWIADRAKEIQATAKQQKKTIGFQKAVAQAKAEADGGLSQVKQNILGMTDLEFTPPNGITTDSNWNEL